LIHEHRSIEISRQTCRARITFSGHRDVIRSLAKDERIWEFNKMLAIDDNYDASYDEYFDIALNQEALGWATNFCDKKNNGSLNHWHDRDYMRSIKKKKRR
jgi:hypothetical protein